jgi:hypothetical protein
VSLAPPAADPTARASNSTTGRSASSAKPAVDAADVDTLLMVLRDRPVLTGNPVAMGNQASQVTMDSQAAVALPNKLPTGASTVTPDPPDLPDKTATPETQVDQEILELPDKAAAKDHPDLPGPQGPTATPETPEEVVNLDNQEKSPKFPAPKDLPDLRVLQANLETMANPVDPEIPEETVVPDLKEMREAQANQAATASPDIPARTEKAAAMARATTAHLLVPPLAIKPTSESNTPNPNIIEPSKSLFGWEFVPGLFLACF